MGFEEDPELVDNSLFGRGLGLELGMVNESGRAGRALVGRSGPTLPLAASRWTASKSSSMEGNEFLPSCIGKAAAGELGSTMIVKSPIAEEGGVSRESCVNLLERAEE